MGDFIQWKRTVTLLLTIHPALHSAEYVARITGGGSNEEIKVKLPPRQKAIICLPFPSDESASFSAGVYHWQLEITETSSGNRLVVDTGDFTALVDLDDNQADPRVRAEQMIAKIDILEGKADSDVSNYSIAGRSISKMTFDELTTARDKYRAELVSHNAKSVRSVARQLGQLSK